MRTRAVSSSPRAHSILLYAAAPRASGRHGNRCETTTMVKPRATYVRSSGLVSFADKNPQAALLEGAEFLLHEQITLGTKAQPQLQTDINQQEQAAPLGILPTDPSVYEADATDAAAGSPSD